MTKAFTNLVVDLTNVVMVKRHGYINTPKSRMRKDDFVPQMLFKLSLFEILSTSKKVGADAIVIVEDSGNVWRKEFYPEYKKKEQVEDIYHEDIFKAFEMLGDFFNECTACKVLKVDKCEGDDIIGYWCMNSSPNVNNVVMSTDRDFNQLISDRTKVYSFLKNHSGYRESEDPEFDLFVKAFRGDKSDNIYSAYPRVQKKRLEKAFYDETGIELLNLFEEKLEDGSKVGDNINFNLTLMDLKSTPIYLQKKIREQINKPCNGSYNQMKVLKTFKENDLIKIIDTGSLGHKILKTVPMF